MTRSWMAKDYTPRDQYFTPKWVFDALNMTFDVDVCSPVGGVPWIPAVNHFDIERDGLVNEWNGNVWMNPPYSQPKPWIEKFVAHGKGIALIAMSRSNAFYALWNNVDARFCVPTKHMKFETPEGKSLGIFMPVTFVAMGRVCIRALEGSGLGHVR